MNDRRILVAYDGSEEAYWALMQAADTARAKGAAIGVVTVPPRIATAALEATEILREHDHEADIHTPIGDPSPRSRGSLGSTRTTFIAVGRRRAGSMHRALEERVSDGVVHTAARTTVIAR